MTRLRRRVLRAAMLLTATAAPLLAGLPAAASAAAADITILGGNASAATECGNEASGLALARQLGIPSQRSDCTSSAAGGTATLSDVRIFVSSAARRRSPAAALFDSLTPGNAPLAARICDPRRAHIPGVVQLNLCRGTARGGRFTFDNVTLVDDQAAGGARTRHLGLLSVPGNSAPQASCVDLVAKPLQQRDDCTGQSDGPSLALNGVDVTSLGSGGDTRHNINVVIRGGRAVATVYCFNVTDGSGAVVQVNNCSAQGTAGDVVLRNVTIELGA
jgi:hypothetical protein